MAKLNDDLVFFVHVPKTAGSTVNHYMEQELGSGYSHCEAFINSKAVLAERVKDANWLSGHVDFDTAKKALSAATDRNIKYFSCMRDPKSQVISHLNWLIEIAHKSEKFFYGHPVNIQEISFEIRAADLSNKYAIMHIFLKNRGLFLNSQSRCILGGGTSGEKAAVRSMIGQYEFVGTNQNLNTLLQKMGMHPEEDDVTKNASKYHFDTGLFDDEEIAHFLNVHNGLDNNLHEIVEDLFGGVSMATKASNNMSEHNAHSDTAIYVADNVPLTDRRDKILSSCNTDGIGLEIGASYNPIARKRDGYNIEVLDHATKEDLREKYKHNPNVDIDNIEEVDHVWSGEPLDKLTGKKDYYDYIIASHVIEHTPDMVAFLSQCETMLKPGGVLALAVPDRRFCFDYLRPNSPTGDVLQAHFEKRKRHTPGTIFDHFSSCVSRNGAGCWTKTSTGELQQIHKLNFAMDRMQESLKSDEYMDGHNWRFTPASFRLIMSDLASLGYIGLTECSSFSSPGCEFIISLKNGGESKPVDRLALAISVADGE